MMKAKDLLEKLNLTDATKLSNENDVESVFTCDLLSLAMGRAPSGCAWLSVMGNINTLAVASLTDVGCVILCHGVKMDDETLKKAREESIPVFYSDEPIFDTALKVYNAINE